MYIFWHVCVVLAERTKPQMQAAKISFLNNIAWSVLSDVVSKMVNGLNYISNFHIVTNLVRCSVFGGEPWLFYFERSRPRWLEHQHCAGIKWKKMDGSDLLLKFAAASPDAKYASFSPVKLHQAKYCSVFSLAPLLCLCFISLTFSAYFHRAI